MSTAIVTIGLTNKDVSAVTCIRARGENSGIMFPVFTFQGNKAALRKQVREIVDKIFNEFKEEK